MWLYIRRLIHALIEAVGSKTEVEVYDTVDNLSRRLRQFPSNIAVLVLMAATQEQLSQLLSIRELLIRVRIILVVPDENIDAHTLYPRFLSYMYSDLADVSAVLSKMVQNSQEMRTGKRR